MNMNLRFSSVYWK